MPSYVITGVSRGLGWAFLSNLSSDANNTVIGLVRNKAATDKRVAEELGGRSNIHILQADITDYEALQKAAADTAAITGGSLDYLIANACNSTIWDFMAPIDDLVKANPQEFNDQFHQAMDVNVLANVHLYHLFMPLILKGTVKKVLFISSAHADMNFANMYDLDTACLYAASKLAMNMLNAKFSNQYKKDGVLFLSICPGMVNTGIYNHLSPEEIARVAGPFVAQVKRYSPNFQGEARPEDAVKDVLKVLENSSVEHRDGGSFVSHFGNKFWV